MIFHDMHMHPQIIKGAERFDAFAEVALQKGIKKVCITDHMPLIGSTLSDRIPVGKVKEYCEIGKAIKEKYDGVLDVKLGIEIDQKELVNNTTGEIYNILFEEGTDVAIFTKRNGDAFNEELVCLDTNGDEILKDKIVGYIKNYKFFE